MLKVMTTDLIGQSPGLDSTAPLGKIERRAEPARHGARQRHGDGIIAALDIVAFGVQCQWMLEATTAKMIEA